MTKVNLILLLILIVSVIGLTGCERVQTVVMDSVSDAPMMESAPVKLVYFIDYPEGGKDAYIEWVSSVVPTLQAPEEVTRIRSYDNEDPTMSPNRLVEFEFDSFLDAAAYLNRADIAEVLEDLPNQSTNVSAYTFIERSDYDKSGEGDYPIKGIYLIDYPLGKKQEYLDWVDSISNILVGPSELKAIASYDNFYGESPNRLVEMEFANQEERETYAAIEGVMAIETELDTRASRWTQHIFISRYDYVNE